MGIRSSMAEGGVRIGTIASMPRFGEITGSRDDGVDLVLAGLKTICRPIPHTPISGLSERLISEHHAGRPGPGSGTEKHPSNLIRLVPAEGTWSEAIHRPALREWHESTDRPVLGPGVPR